MNTGAALTGLGRIPAAKKAQPKVGRGTCWKDTGEVGGEKLGVDMIIFHSTHV